MFRICSQLLALIACGPITRRHRQSGFHISPCRSVVALHQPSTDRSPPRMGRPHDAIVPRQLRHLFADLDFAVCFTLTCVFHTLRSNWRLPRFRVPSGHSAYCETWDVDGSNGGKARWVVFFTVATRHLVAQPRCLTLFLSKGQLSTSASVFPFCSPFTQKHIPVAGWVFMLKSCGCSLLTDHHGSVIRRGISVSDSIISTWICHFAIVLQTSFHMSQVGTRYQNHVLEHDSPSSSDQGVNAEEGGKMARSVPSQQPPARPASPFPGLAVVRYRILSTRSLEFQENRRRRLDLEHPIVHLFECHFAFRQP